MIKLSPPNAKLAKLVKRLRLKNRKLYSLDLPTGCSCPGAQDCKSTAKPSSRNSQKIVDSPFCVFRCFSASQEVLYPKLHKLRHHNLEQLRSAKTVKKMTDLIITSIPDNTGIIRLHVGGDFFSQAYFDAIVRVSKWFPGIVFYGYTKSLPYWTKRLGSIPDNLRLTASRGGKYDYLIDDHNLPYAVVVFSKKEGLPLDKNDYHAYNQTGFQNFALLLHGIQPKGTRAAEALKLLKNNTYTRKVKL